MACLAALIIGGRGRGGVSTSAHGRDCSNHGSSCHRGRGRGGVSTSAHGHDCSNHGSSLVSEP